MVLCLLIELVHQSFKLDLFESFLHVRFGYETDFGVDEVHECVHEFM